MSVSTRAQRNGQARIAATDADAAIGTDDVGLDQLITQLGRRRLIPGAEAARLAVSLARRPLAAARRGGRAVTGLAEVARGTATAAPAPGDRRFADPAWTDSWLFRRLLQGYLVLADEARGLVDDAQLDWENDQRLRLVVDNLIDALAPTNWIWSNPAAMKATIDHGGRNLVAGARALIGDMSSAPRIPANHDPSGFVVGETVAATPGAVVRRQPMYELIQYKPQTAEVREYPVLFVPPMISKFYCVDLSPGRSLAEFLVQQGQQVFTVSWKNATKREAGWGFDDYMTAVIEAIRVTAAVCATDKVHVVGLCLGGIMTTCAIGHLVQTGEADCVAGLTLNVTVLDTAKAGPVPALATPATAAIAVANSKRQGYLSGNELASTFAWLRPNEMIWNNWVNSYLMGKRPPAFDLLYWNADSMNMPAAAHRDLVDFGVENPLTEPGRMQVLGSGIDVSRIDCDAYVVGAETDHLTPWQHCYRNVHLLGGETRFVLSNSGHIAAIINPPGNPKSRHHVADDHPVDAAEWLAGAEQRPGTWWFDWDEWLAERSGEAKAAPRRLGNRTHKVLDPAPGSYVRERAVG